MSFRAKDACRLNPRLRRAMQPFVRGTFFSSTAHIPLSLQGADKAVLGADDVVGQATILQVWRAKGFESHLLSSLSSTRSASTILHGSGRNHIFYPCSSSHGTFYGTSAIILERACVDALQTEPNASEEVKQAMAQYLEQTLKVDENLVDEICEKAPYFVSRLVEKTKAMQKKTSSDCGNESVNNIVKELLAKSKFKGVEPYLESIGFTPQEIERVRVYSRLGLPGVMDKINLLMSIGITAEEIPRVVTIHPRALSNALSNQKLKIQYLLQLGLSEGDICKLVVAYPKALSFGLKNGSLPLVDFLRSAGVKDGEIGKVVVRCPQLLTLNIDRKLQPAIRTLESVGITGSHLARVLVTQPSLLRRRLERNIAFCRTLGLDAKPGVIARLLVTCPNFSVDGCKARMSYLESLGLTKEQIVCMIIKNPAFLSFNVQSSLTPKIDYLVNVMGRSVQELVTASTYLTMSLENRIRPRYTVLSALERAGLVEKTYSLSTLVTWNDEYFFKRFVERSPKEIKKLWLYSSSDDKDQLSDKSASSTAAAGG